MTETMPPAVRGRRPGSGAGSAFPPRGMLASQAMPVTRDACRTRGRWFLKAGLVRSRTLQTFLGEGSGPSHHPQLCGCCTKAEVGTKQAGGVPVKLD